MGKKKLDELFQEKFLDFKEVPDERVWASIEASLDKKKKKRIAPLWWQLGGIAAALLIGFMLFDPFNENTAADEIITDVEHVDTNNDHDDGTNSSNEIPFKNDGSNQTEVVVTNDTIQVKITVTNDKKAQMAATPKKKLLQFDGRTNRSSNSAEATTDNWPVKNEAVARTQNGEAHKKSIKKDKGIDAEKTKTIRTALAETDVNAKKEKEENSITANADKAVIKNEKGFTDPDIRTTVADGAIEKETIEDTTENPKKKSIFEEIENQEEEAVAKNSSGKWSAGPSIAPVYFNAFGEGSPVHSIFVPNSKSGNINLSYGMSVAYEISPKLSVRSGIHKVDYGYDTNDVAFSSSLIASTNGQIDNIDYALTSKNLVVTSKPGGNPNAKTFSSVDVSPAKDASREGVMSQQLGYLEVPIELNYALIDTKFGVNIIGGVSSLFLIDNSVALTSGNLITEMGEANNINDLNFSANMGLGLNYKFSPKVRLNIEPVFKYQLNTFSETDGSFRPYSLGVYSGLSFRF